MNTPIPTPRTDANAGCLIDSEEVVPADFARKLERELTTEVERLKSARWKFADDPEQVFTDDYGWLHINVKADIDELKARAERAEAELAAERARRDDLVAGINDACITLASAKDDCDDYALLNTGFKLEAVREVLIQYIPGAAMKEGK